MHTFYSLTRIIGGCVEIQKDLGRRQANYKMANARRLRLSFYTASERHHVDSYFRAYVEHELLFSQLLLLLRVPLPSHFVSHMHELFSGLLVLGPLTANWGGLRPSFFVGNGIIKGKETTHCSSIGAAMCGKSYEYYANHTQV